jgi:hypothetical protein
MSLLIEKTAYACAVVPRVGLEPTRLAAPDFESGTSTNSITEAGELSGTKLLRGESVTNTALLSD